MQFDYFDTFKCLLIENKDDVLKIGKIKNVEKLILKTFEYK